MIRALRQAIRPDRPRITHVIGSLDVGGAERALCSLVASIDPALAEMKIVALIAGGALTDSVRRRGIEVETLAMRPGRPDPSAVVRLARRLRADRPDLVVTWMYHANLIGGLAAKLADRIPVVWNIRHTWLDPRRSKRSTRWIARAGGALSQRLPEAVVYVAHAAQESHAALGYACSQSSVIPNGFDLNEFRPDPAARLRVRHDLGLAPTTELVGLVGRFHPDKDHGSFMAAAGRLCRNHPQARFLLCGEGITPENRQLTSWAEQSGVREVCHFLGPREDMPRIAAALDVAVCSSLTEAFPRAVGEAMACGVPCVVTDVGDAAHLVGNTGRVVPAGDSAALASAMDEILALDDGARRTLGQRARERILDNFSHQSVVARHWKLWFQIATGQRNGVNRQRHDRLHAA